MEQELPKAIQAELEAAEAIEKQLAESAAAPEGNTQQPEAEPAQPTAPEPQQVVEPTPQQQPGEDWQAKYRVLEGKYSAEVPRLYGQLKEQATALEQMQQKLEELSKKPEPEQSRESLVTSEDEKTFGSDLVDLARRVTRDEVGQALARISAIEATLKSFADLPKRLDAVVETQVESAEERYWGAVNTRVPDWRQVDQDPRWVEWLNTRAPGAVKTYRELAGEAIQAGQVEPIAELVAAWKQSAGLVQQQQQSNKSQQELNRQVAPDTSNAAEVPQTKKQWTKEEYERAFDPRNYSQMSEQEIEQLQIEADLAYQEGRVSW